MSEEVNTGGMKTIRHENEKYELEEERERRIDEGFQKAGERKRKNRIIWTIIVILALIILGLAGYFLLV